MGRVVYTELEARGILTPQKKGNSLPFDFSINPYVGCAFGCSYCYVREMQYGDDAGEKSTTWGSWVRIKSNAVALIHHAVKRLYGKRIFMSSATDPYQPVERRLGLSRAILETLVMAYPERLHVQTRSPLVTRDLDVLLRFGDSVSVGVSIPTDDDDVRRVFEPSAPSIAQRLAALEALHDAGIRTIASHAPLLPCNPSRLGELTRGRADSFWVDEMRYHWTDDAMKERYRGNGWGDWLRPSADHVRRAIEHVWKDARPRNATFRDAVAGPAGRPPDD